MIARARNPLDRMRKNLLRPKNPYVEDAAGALFDQLDDVEARIANRSASIEDRAFLQELKDAFR